MDALLSFDKISYSYNHGKENATKAVVDCSFSINRGDFVGIVGESGSGKSTILNILGGLLVPQEGTYYLDGVNMCEQSESVRTSIRNKMIGTVLQSYGLLDDRNALENVALPLMFTKYPWRKIEGRCREIMKSLGIEELRKKRPSELSGGQCQRVAIARALVNSPQLILADEPTGALDSQNTEILMELLHEINKKGTTIVLVTHDVSTLKYCNRNYLIHDGRMKEK